jgi:hypothetical protein
LGGGEQVNDKKTVYTAYLCFHTPPEVLSDVPPEVIPVVSVSASVKKKNVMARQAMSLPVQIPTNAIRMKKL